MSMTRKRNFLGFGKRKAAVGLKPTGAKPHRRSRSTMTVTQAMTAALQAGKKRGDTGLFKSWLEETGLDSRSTYFKGKLEAKFRQGVNEGEGTPDDSVPSTRLTAKEEVLIRELKRETVKAQKDAKREAVKQAEEVLKQELKSQKDARKEAKSTLYHGRRIWKDGEVWRTDLEPQSEFDSVLDAKQFVDVQAKSNPKSNPDWGQVLAPFSLLRPVHSVRQPEWSSALAAKLKVSGWVGRPLLAIESESGKGFQLLTGSHRYGALQSLKHSDQWPINLPNQMVPAVVLTEDDFRDDGWERIRSTYTDEDRMSVLADTCENENAIIIMAEELARDWDSPTDSKAHEMADAIHDSLDPFDYSEAEEVSMSRNPKEYDFSSPHMTELLDRLTDNQLQRRLMIVRSQMPEAFRQKNDAATINLQNHEEAIVQARLRKFDKQTEREVRRGVKSNPRQRKTEDEWQLWINYGQGWEHEISESTYREAKQRVKEYRENAPQYPVKLKFARVRIEGASNPRIYKASNPRFSDAQAMRRAHPSTFEAPSKEALDTITSGDFVKVADTGERFWVLVTSVRGSKLTGTVNNYLVRSKLKFGQKVSFEKKNVYDIDKSSSKNPRIYKASDGHYKLEDSDGRVIASGTVKEVARAAKAHQDRPMYNKRMLRGERVGVSNPREVWRMTREEFLQGIRDARKRKPWAEQDAITKRILDTALGSDSEGVSVSQAHRFVVESALRRGKPVPPEVLADYPDLQPAAQSNPRGSFRVEYFRAEEVEGVPPDWSYVDSYGSFQLAKEAADRVFTAYQEQAVRVVDGEGVARYARVKRSEGPHSRRQALIDIHKGVHPLQQIGGHRRNPSGSFWAMQYMDTAKSEADARQELDAFKLQDGYIAGRVLAPPTRGYWNKAGAGPDPEAGESDSSATSLFEEFHGEPSTLIEEVEEREHYAQNLTRLGTLVEMKVRTITNLDAVMTIKSAAPYLDCTPDGRQLHFTGGDQTLDLASLKMDGEEWLKDSMVIGVLYEVTYRTTKGFDKFKLTDYYHNLGEESGVQPLLIYDRLNAKCSVSGGHYHTTARGVEN